MKKKLKIVGIVLAVLVVLYGGYTLFLGPDGFTSEDELVESYITNLSSTDVCVTHFNEETLDVCNVFANTLKSEEVSVVLVDVNGDEAEVTLNINGTNESFTFIFISEEATGVKGFIYSSYYLIDYMD